MNELCQVCTHTRRFHWDDGKCRDACHCPRFVSLIDRLGMCTDLLAMAERAEYLRQSGVIFIAMENHQYYYFAQACRAFAAELEER